MARRDRHEYTASGTSTRAAGGRIVVPTFARRRASSGTGAVVLSKRSCRGPRTDARPSVAEKKICRGPVRLTRML
jgi:hypothetical protein